MVKRLCETHGVRVLYLPSYSSDYNPIEKFFSVLKKWLKRYYEAYVNEESFEEFLRMSVKACSNEKLVKQHFRHAGIHVT